MVTTEIFESLKELQTILVQKYELEKKVADAPKQLRNQEELLAKTQKEFILFIFPIISWLGKCII